MRYIAILMSLLVVFTCSAAETVGFLIANRDVSDNDDANAAWSDVVVTRDGATLEPYDGMDVYAGDTVTTGAAANAGIVFLDNSAVTLRESTRLTVSDYGFPNAKVATHLALATGSAYFSVHHRPQDAHFFVNTARSQVEVKGTQFAVIAAPSPTDSTMTLTKVAVTNGTVSLAPDRNVPYVVDISVGNNVTFSISNSAVDGYTGTPISLSKGNIDPKTIKSLLSGAMVFAEVNISSKGDAKISATVHNGDGSITVDKETDSAAGQVLTVTKSTKNGKVTVSKISQKGSTESIFNLDGNGNKITKKLKFGAGTIQVSTSSKDSLKGTVSTLADGTILGTATSKKSGATITDAVQNAAGLRNEIFLVTALDGSNVVTTTTFSQDGSVTKGSMSLANGVSQGVETITVTHSDGSTVTSTVNASLAIVNGVPVLTQDAATFQAQSNTPPVRPAAAPAFSPSSGIPITPNELPVSQ